MSTERWQRLEQIFAEACTLSGDARTELVARACGPDEALRREALSLVAAGDAPGEFLETPALNRLAQSVASEGWSLRPGDRIGAYTIVRLLGRGGGGEVWRARDERLDRDVAIKILLPHFSSDPQRLQRFTEEARTAGGLNHSNILTVYDVGEHRGIPFLVSECLEGTSLRQRIITDPVPPHEAVAVTLGVARGLAAAHARGIVHRDLKPENLFIKSDGEIKILDFGLAKLQSALQEAPRDDSHTTTGVIVGTAGYMAPEQIRSERVDGRTDLFALGVVMYEMLAGRHPFRGVSTFETLNAVLTIEPPDLWTANERVPRPLARIVMRLLKKAPDARFQSALDLAWALEQDPAVEPSITTISSRGDSRWWQSRTVAWITAPLLTAGALIAGWWTLPAATPEARPVPLTQFTLTLPQGAFLDSAPMVSPDSKHIAFVGKDATGSRLFVHSLASREPLAIPNSDGAVQPFWSPDSTALGFFARGQLLKVAWPGGAPVVIASAPLARGGAWSPSGDIAFAPDVILSGLSRVSADGGAAAPATLLDPSRGETSHWWPAFLPDGMHLLYFALSSDDRHRGVYLGRIDRPPSRGGAPLIRSDGEVIYAPLPGTNDGVLLYVVDGRIEARRFDGARKTVAADARAIGLAVGENSLYHPTMLSASADVLAFAQSAVPSGNRLESVDRNGARLRLWDKPEAQNWPRVSPDGLRIALQRVDPLGGNPDIWVENLERGTRLRVTTALEPDIQPVWSPDGRHLAYVSGSLPGRSGNRKLSIAAADGTGVIRSFSCPGSYCEPSDWSADGRVLLVNVLDARGWDVWTASPDRATVQPLLTEAFSERDARFSPDGRWIAYVSNETGRSEVSIRALSGAPTRIVLSGNGGDQPVWRRDGSELFFVNPAGRLQRVTAQWTRDGLPRFGLPTQPEVPPIGFGHWGTQYDVSSDGRSIYFLPKNQDPAPREIHVVVGWRALLE